MALATYLAAKSATRVQEVTHSTGLGNIVLEGATPNYYSFNSKFTDQDKVYYSILTSDGSEFECGIGIFTAPNLLQRLEVSESSNNNSLVNFSSGIKVVVCAPTAQWGNDVVSASVMTSMAITIALS